MPSGDSIHRASTRALSVVLVVLGAVMLVLTVVRGGGPLAIGVLLGLLFVLAGGGRLYLTTRD
jgi:hypothetical protein